MIALLLGLFLAIVSFDLSVGQAIALGLLAYAAWTPTRTR